MSKRIGLFAPLLVTTALIAGCGSSSSPKATSAPSAKQAAPAAAKAKEVNPPGDIPDTQAFVPYAPAGAGFSVKVPEGWGRTGNGSKVTFTANLNSIAIETRPAAGSLTTAAAKRSEVPAMAHSFKNFRLTSVGTVTRSAGTAIRIRYQATSAPNAVTGKAETESAERYIFSHGGKLVVITLSGPKGADNVDPWKTVTDSLRWTR